MLEEHLAILIRLNIIVLFFATPFLLLGQDAKSLIQRGDDFGYQQIDSAIHYWVKGGKLAVAEGKKTVAYYALEKAAGSYLYMDNHERSVNLYRLILPLADSDHQLADTYNGLSHQYVYDNSFKADTVFQNAIKYALLSGDSTSIAACHGNFAVYLQQQGKYKEAVNLLLEAMEYNSKPLPKLTICNNLAELLLLMEHPDRAKEYVDMSVKISEENNFKVRNKFVALLLGKYYNYKGEAEKAEAEFNRILANTGSTATSSSLEANFGLAVLRLKANKLEEAEAFLANSMHPTNVDEQVVLTKKKLLKARIELARGNLNQAENIAKEVFRSIKPKEYAIINHHVHELLSEIFEKKGDPAKAFYHFRQFKIGEDALFRTKQAIEIFEQESRYKRKEQADAITFLDQRNEINTLKLQEKNRIILWSGLGLLIFSGLSFLLYHYYRKGKKQSAIIQESLEEKEVLLKEIHHRVKNNLQMVSSLLSLQSRYINDDAAREAIKQGQSRVRSMALIHQDLYSRDNLKEVSVKEYLHRLCGELYDTYNISTDDILLQLEIENIDLDIDTMIPIGLIINELVANALKYAFPEKKEGWLKIKLQEIEDQLVLNVADNGIGFDYDSSGKSSFGYKLIQTLCKRLKGEIEVVAHQGSSITIRFNKYKLGGEKKA